MRPAIRPIRPGDHGHMVDRMDISRLLKVTVGLLAVLTLFAAAFAAQTTPQTETTQPLRRAA